MTDSFEPNRLGPAIDAQGAVNEQATGYANFVYDLWTTAERELAACGYTLPGWITSRIAQMPAFLARPPSPTATWCRSATPTWSAAPGPGSR